jgi:hypothetical protein
LFSIRLFVHLGSNLGHGLLNLDTGSRDISDQSASEWPDRAYWAISRDLPWTGRECDQRAFTGFHFGKACLHRDAKG